MFSVTQSYIKCNKGLFYPVVAGTGHQDHWCSQRGQRQCQVPLQPGEVLWPSLQQWPCKKDTSISLKMNALKANHVHCIHVKLWKWRPTEINTVQCPMCASACHYTCKLDKHSQAIISVSPQVSMVDAIPGLINAIRMIHSISRYYNTSEKITSLFVKVGVVTTLHNATMMKRIIL